MFTLYWQEIFISINFCHFYYLKQPIRIVPFYVICYNGERKESQIYNQNSYTLLVHSIEWNGSFNEANLGIVPVWYEIWDFGIRKWFCDSKIKYFRYWYSDFQYYISFEIFSIKGFCYRYFYWNFHAKLKKWGLILIQSVWYFYYSRATPLTLAS